MKTKNWLLIIGVSALSALASVWGLSKWNRYQNSSFQEPGKIPANYASFQLPGNENLKGMPVDFTAAATAATPAVVHIKTKIGAKTVANKQRSPFGDIFGDDIFGDLFGGGRTMQIPEQRASGSGVIISNDGYIVTNNHVIENAEEINVTLNDKQTLKAELVGTDPSSDLAVIKINKTSLPYMLWGNSDEVKLGQWVLAIGYPLTLDVTVTAGIVSAKARSLNINSRKSDSPIESFIQTDAAVNQGNSGGALIDTDGKLIGINSAIASPTGSYAGYSYAIPVNIVKKITGDLMKFGAVQRAYIGLSYIPDGAPEETYTRVGAQQGKGVFVTDVTADGAAKAAGIKTGDYITAVNGVKVHSGSEMVEQVANYKPGDKVTVTYTRSGKENTVNLVLKNKSGNFNIVNNTSTASINDRLGGELVNYDAKKAKEAGITGGVLVKKINSGVLKNSKMQDGFVITSVNGNEVTTVEELNKALKGNGRYNLEGIYPGFEGNYAYPLLIGGNNDNEDNQEP
jgi:serine protease Do